MLVEKQLSTRDNSLPRYQHRLVRQHSLRCWSWEWLQNSPADSSTVRRRVTPEPASAATSHQPHNCHLNTTVIKSCFTEQLETDRYHTQCQAASRSPAIQEGSSCAAPPTCRAAAGGSRQSRDPAAAGTEGRLGTAQADTCISGRSMLDLADKSCASGDTRLTSDPPTAHSLLQLPPGAHNLALTNAIH